MELKHLLQPCDIKIISLAGITAGDQWGDTVIKLSELNPVDEKPYDIAILGINEGLNSPSNSDCQLSPDLIRSYLYGLRPNSRSLKILDLGNLLGKTIKDKFWALETIVAATSSQSIPLIILGGSQDFTIPMFKGFNAQFQNKSLSVIDSIYDFVPGSDDFSSQNFLSHLNSSSDLPIKINCIGIQRYLNSPKQDEWISQRKFETLRLGEIKGNGIAFTEPLLRDSDMLSMDVSALASGDMPAQHRPVPNGLSAYEACQLSWYAGMSDRLKVFSFFELNPSKDFNNNGVLLSAQIIWHFCEGLAFRSGDYPYKDIESYQTYHVPLDDLKLNIRFFCNANSDRWWVELPQNGRPEIVSCTFNDYQSVKNNQIPDKWWSLLAETDCNSE